MTPTDPFYGSQWHLAALGNLGAELLINRIWNEYDGTGIYVGVYDDGIQINHYELDDNYDASREVFINGTQLSGNVTIPADTHGTSVAGLIAAEANGIDTVGVAFGANLTGVNIFDQFGQIFINSTDPLTRNNFFSALTQGNAFDVVNHSWGSDTAFQPDNNLNNIGGFAQRTAEAYETVAETGRNNLGTIVVQSAGNESRDASVDGVNASRFTITVAATHNDGFATSYSNYGASVLVSAAGGDDPTVRSGLGIVTTDRTGTDGYNLRLDPTGNHDYTNDFDGTSAAAPIVSGVAALMLDANPNLGWRDVQNILAASADHTGSAIGTGPTNNELNTWFVNGASNWNGGGMHFSEDYGYGKVNAFAAVRMAEVWTRLGQAQTSQNEAYFNFNPAITGSNAIADVASTVFNFSVFPQVELEHIDLTLSLTHSYFTDLRIFLLSAEGTEVQLTDGRAGDATTADSGLTWTFGIDALRGELSQGTWTLRIDDVALGDVGVLNSINFAGFGSLNDSNDVYTFTNEFRDMLLLDSSRGTLNDTNNGTDWVNAAAVTDHLIINMVNGATSTANGVAYVTLGATANIENVVTGDGNDRINGNSLGNTILGMRGNDILYGYASFDTLEGGAGLDQLYGGLDPDILRGGADNDSMYGEEDNDTLDGGSGMDYLDGGAGDDAASYQSSLSGVRVDLLFRSGNTGDAVGDTFVSIENLHGSNSDDILYATEGDNVILGNEGKDLIWARGGNDYLDGGAGDDSMYGREDNDTLYGGAGQDYMDGGDGFDIVSYAASTAPVIVDMVYRSGNTGDAVGDSFVGFEAIRGSQYGDRLTATEGNDTIYGGSGADYLEGRGGQDTIYGELGVDQIYAGAGDDTLIGGLDADYMDGGANNDTASYAFASAIGSNGVSVDLQNIIANTGEAFGDYLYQIENITGSNFDDRLLGDTNGNVLTGGGGADLLFARAGTDTLYGDAGSDILEGGLGADYMDGGADNDTASYASAVAAVQVDLLLGNTAAPGSANANTGEAVGDLLYNIENLTGSIYGDRLLGTSGDNVLNGGDGADMLWARAGNDTLNGGLGIDTIYGLEGLDILNGGGGNDIMDGGADFDTFRYDSASFGQDTINLFQDGLDKFSLAGSGLTFASFVITQSGANTLMTLNAGNTITLTNFTAGNITGADFI